MNFQDKVVLITGAASGIGAATALRFAKMSAQLALVDKDNLEKTLTTCEDASNRRHLAISADLCKLEDVLTIIPKTIKHYGKLDILVNNAGISSRQDILNGDILADYDKVMTLQLKSPIVLTNKAAPYLVKSKGNIVNVGSVGALKPGMNKSLYNVTNAGLEMFTKCTALELSRKGVRANCVHPGIVKTNINLSRNPNADLGEFYNDWNKRLPFGVIEADEVAEIICFLASPDARSITGSSYVIDGGVTILPLNL